MAEDEMVGWHHCLNGHEFVQTLGDSKGQGSLAQCSPWGRKESDVTERLNNNDGEASCCTPESNIMFYVNFVSIFKKEKKFVWVHEVFSADSTPRWKHPPPGLAPKQESAGFQSQNMRLCGHMASVTGAPLCPWRKTSVDDMSLSERAGL